MQVILYNLAMDERYLYKNNKTVIWSGNGEPDAGFSIDSPTLSRVGPLSPENMAKVNYARIPTLGRSYVITDRSRMGGDYWELSLETDAITSFADNITNAHGFVMRAHKDTSYNNAGNPLLTDSAYPIECKATIRDIPYGGPVLWKTSNQMFFTSGKNTVICISCRAASEGSGTSTNSIGLQMGCLYVAIDPSQMAGFINELTGFWGNADWDTVMSHITDIYSLPIPPSMSSSPVGGIVFEGTTAAAGLQSYDARAITNVQASTSFTFSLSNVWNGNYKDFPPFKQLTLEFVPFGRFTLDMSICHNASAIKVSVTLNTMSGNASLFYTPIFGDEEGTTSYLASASLAIRTKLNVNQSITSYVHSTLLPRLSETVIGIGTGVGAAALGEPALASQSIGKALIGGNIESPASTQITGDSGGIIGSPTMRLISRENTEAPNIYGYPVEKSGRIGDFYGYVSARDVVLDIPAATDKEIKQIRQRLESGILRNVTT